jgi:hypothetical protein
VIRGMVTMGRVVVKKLYWFIGFGEILVKRVR